MRKLALMVIVGSSLLLQGCGFHLRGTVTLPEVASNVYVSGNDFDLVTDLKDGLDTNGARINESETAADSSIIIESEFQRKIRTLDNRGIASAYRLFYRARFILTDAEGQVIHTSGVLTQRRDFEYSASEILEKDDEEEFLREGMRKELVQNILRQISKL